MEQAAGFGSSHRRNDSARARPLLWLLAGCTACCAATAQDFSAPLDGASDSARAESPVRLEVQASRLPRLQATDEGFQAPRVDMSLLPGRGTGLGLALGMSGFAPREPGLPGLAPARPAFDLGLHWRHTLEDERQIDITAWRRMTASPDALTLIQQRDPAVYAARVELKLNGARKSGFTAASGFIGMQLQSGARVSIRRKDGRPMVYYRTSF